MVVAISIIQGDEREVWTLTRMWLESQLRDGSNFYAINSLHVNTRTKMIWKITVPLLWEDFAGRVNE